MINGNSKDFYEKTDEKYPIRRFYVIGSKKDDVLHFYHRGIVEDSKSNVRYYSTYSEDEITYYEECRDALLNNLPMPQGTIENKTRGSFIIDPDNKTVNLTLACYEARHGFATTIYHDLESILRELKVEDPHGYTLILGGMKDHPALQRIKVKDLIQKTNQQPSLNAGAELIRDLGNFQYPMYLNEYNTLIEYAIKSKVPMKLIADSINNNGLNIMPYNGNLQFNKQDVAKFLSFGIRGISLSTITDRIKQSESLRLMEFIPDANENDSSKLFIELLRGIEENSTLKPKDCIPEIQKKYGSIAHFILNWKDSALLVKHLPTRLKESVGKTALLLFERLDSNRSIGWGDLADDKLKDVLHFLKDAEMLDKEMYIALYLKALARNTEPKNFHLFVSSYISQKERQEAIEEIEKNDFYPAPTTKQWLNSRAISHPGETSYRIIKIEIPCHISRKRNILGTISQDIKKQRKARGIPIRTDMVNKTTKTVVSNLEDWLLGVDGVGSGYLQVSEDGRSVLLPPRTPENAISIVRTTLEAPDYGVRF